MVIADSALQHAVLLFPLSPFAFAAAFTTLSAINIFWPIVPLSLSLSLAL